jgi:predicted dehydrogenase
VIDDLDVAALDIVTDPVTHHSLAVPALQAGKHVISEKPLALTPRTARAMIAAAKKGKATLATAENYRRGNGSRVARAVLDAGLIGPLHLMVDSHLGGSDRVIITPWRHDRLRGSIALDMGVHLTDMVQYLLGDIESVHGRGLIAEPVRRAPDGTAVTATGEDSLLAQLVTSSGVTVQLGYLPSGPGQSYFQRTVHGRLGSMRLPADRSGGPVVVYRADCTLQGEELLAELGGSPVDRLGADLFGSSSAEYQLEFAESDAAHLAIELHDFADAVLTGRSPEVDGVSGLNALAAVYAVYESQLLGRAVRVADVASGALHASSADIDEALGVA